jgi:hypothetical protein
MEGRRSDVSRRDQAGDTVRGPAQALLIEPRWPVALAVLTAALLVYVLPDRVRMLPFWVLHVIVIALIVPMAAIMLSTAKERWLRIERTIMPLFFVFAGIGMVGNLTRLIAEMVNRSGQVSGIQLLTSGVAIWITNVITFSLLYWQMDRGGPEAQTANASSRPDWLFPHEGAREDVPPDWRPTFVDYLFLGFSTATAFSPTDTLPLTSRAKILMMLQSAISLVTIVAVMSRAINILGS